jgi:hypothetical protein
LQEDIEESFPKLTDFLLKGNLPEGSDLLERLERLKAKAPTVLTNLLTPPNMTDAPSCLIHMDFWDQNLLFKDLYATCGGVGIQTRILDWQNIMNGMYYVLLSIVASDINPCKLDSSAFDFHSRNEDLNAGTKTET